MVQQDFYNCISKTGFAKFSNPAVMLEILKFEESLIFRNKRLNFKISEINNSKERIILSPLFYNYSLALQNYKHINDELNYLFTNGNRNYFVYTTYALMPCAIYRHNNWLRAIVKTRQNKVDVTIEGVDTQFKINCTILDLRKLPPEYCVVKMKNNGYYFLRF